MLSSILLLSEAPSYAGDSNTLILRDKLFIKQINYIYMNFNDYKDKTIVVEGAFDYAQSNDPKLKDLKIPLVYRLGPGCCTNDTWAGFLLEYDGVFPPIDSWIRVTGKQKMVPKGDFNELYLIVSKLEVLPKRGKFRVKQ